MLVILVTFKFPDWTFPLELMCDASDTAVGVVLEKRKDKLFYTIYNASHTLDATQENYTTTGKELLAIVFTFDEFRHYLVLPKVVIYMTIQLLSTFFVSRMPNPS